MEEFISWLNLEQFNHAKFSKLFINQLVNLFNARGCVDEIVEEIQALEHPESYQSFTKPPTEFSKHPLKGLWHKHFFWVSMWLRIFFFP